MNLFNIYAWLNFSVIFKLRMVSIFNELKCSVVFMLQK